MDCDTCAHLPHGSSCMYSTGIALREIVHKECTYVFAVGGALNVTRSSFGYGLQYPVFDAREMSDRYFVGL